MTESPFESSSTPQKRSYFHRIRKYEPINDNLFNKYKVTYSRSYPQNNSEQQTSCKTITRMKTRNINATERRKINEDSHNTVYKHIRDFIIS